MAKIVLITGGVRAGKSSYAQKLAEAQAGPLVYLATTVPFDEELRERVAVHQEARRRAGWVTVEEPLALARAIRECASPATLLVDCLTMWVNNLVWEARAAGERAGLPTEEHLAAECREMIAACRGREGVTLFVTNEVGLGIVPADPLTRLYRDLLGRVNQVLAAAADAVVFLLSGLPLVLKNDDILSALPGSTLDHP